MGSGPTALQAAAAALRLPGPADYGVNARTPCPDCGRAGLTDPTDEQKGTLFNLSLEELVALMGRWGNMFLGTYPLFGRKACAALMWCGTCERLVAAGELDPDWLGPPDEWGQRRVFVRGMTRENAAPGLVRCHDDYWLVESVRELKHFENEVLKGGREFLRHPAHKDYLARLERLGLTAEMLEKMWLGADETPGPAAKVEEATPPYGLTGLEPPGDAPRPADGAYSALADDVGAQEW
jgi:hypothetical protein